MTGVRTVSFDLAWDTSSDWSWNCVGSACQQGFLIQVVAINPPVGGKASFNLTAASGDTTKQITGLTPAAAYEVSVRAINTVGPALFSPVLSVSTEADVPNKMLAPTSPSNTAVSYALEWQNLEYNNGAAITQYLIQTTATTSCPQSSCPAKTNCVGGANTAFNITGLTPGVSYQWTIQACNSQATDATDGCTGCGTASPSLGPLATSSTAPETPSAVTLGTKVRSCSMGRPCALATCLP